MSLFFLTSVSEKGAQVAVTGMANIAVKVVDLDAACAFYEAAGAEVRGRMHWNNGERADVLPRAGHDHALHPRHLRGRGRPARRRASSIRHCSPTTSTAELEGHTVVWGPAIVEGAFGKRRIAFVNAPGGIRLEFMEQLEPLDPSPRPRGALQ